VVTDITGVPGIKITRQSFRAEDIIGRERTQVVTRADILVPEQKPNVVQVIDSLVECDVTDVDIIRNKAIVRGTISSRIIYESDSPYQTVHVVHGETTFEHFVEIPGLDEDMTVTADCEVEFAQFDVANNGRMVVGRIVIMLKVRATTIRTLDLVVDVEGLPDGCALAKELVRIQEVLAERRRQSIVSAVLDIPEEKPDVVSVVKHEADIQIERITVIKNKVLVEGIIHLKTVYEGLVPAQTVHVVHHDIRFADFVHLPGATEDMTAEVDVDVEHVSYDVGTGDPIAVQIVLKIKARIVVTRQVHVVVKVTVVEAICNGVCTGEWVNVRPGPSTDGPPIARLARGEQVAVVSMDGQWFRVRLHDGRHGFVFGQFLKCDCIPRG
ncbi:MAG: SPOCS domain-containing protein, partial [Bacillota bacterium]